MAYLCVVSYVHYAYCLLLTSIDQRSGRLLLESFVLWLVISPDKDLGCYCHVDSYVIVSSACLLTSLLSQSYRNLIKALLPSTFIFLTGFVMRQNT